MVCRVFEAGQSPTTTSYSTRLWVEDGEQQVIVGLEQCLQLRGHQRRLQEGDVHPLRTRLAVRGGDGEGAADEAEARDGEADLVDLREGKGASMRGESPRQCRKVLWMPEVTLLSNQRGV